MEIFTTLEDAKLHGGHLASRGIVQTIYELETGDYIVVARGKWPPPNSWPVFKWTGNTDGWVPILARLDCARKAHEACCLFNLLGYWPVVVEFPGITFDLFLRQEDIPLGAWITFEKNNYRNGNKSEESEFDAIEVEIPIT